MDTETDDKSLSNKQENICDKTEQAIENAEMDIDASTNNATESSNKKPLNTGKKVPQVSQTGEKGHGKPQKLVNINMFDKTDHEEETEKDQSTGSSDNNEDEEENLEPEPEAVTNGENAQADEIAKFTSADLNDDMCNMYFRAFKTYQRDFLTGMDISDEMEKKSPKFDSNKESELWNSKKKSMYFEKENPISSPFSNFELDNIFPPIEYNILKQLPWQLSLYRTLLSSRHFFPAKSVISVIKTILEVKPSKHDLPKFEVYFKRAIILIDK